MVGNLAGYKLGDLKISPNLGQWANFDIYPTYMDDFVDMAAQPPLYVRGHPWLMSQNALS